MENQALNATQKVRIEKAKAVTAEQLRIAMEMAKAPGLGQPFVAPILQALATNYAATVAASKD